MGLYARGAPLAGWYPALTGCLPGLVPHRPRPGQLHTGTPALSAPGLARMSDRYKHLCRPPRGLVRVRRSARGRPRCASGSSRSAADKGGTQAGRRRYKPFLVHNIASPPHGPRQIASRRRPPKGDTGGHLAPLSIQPHTDTQWGDPPNSPALLPHEPAIKPIKLLSLLSY